MLPQSPVHFRRQRGGRGGGWRSGDEGFGGVGGGVQGGNEFTPSFPSETKESPAPRTTVTTIEFSNIVNPAQKTTPQGTPKATTTPASDPPLVILPTRDNGGLISSSSLVSSSGMPRRTTFLSGQSTNTQVLASSSNSVSHLPPAPTSSSRAVAQHAVNPGSIIAPVCVAVLALLLLSGVIYFRVTRKRWPFAANKPEDAVLQPYQVGEVGQMDNGNPPATPGSRLRQTSGTAEKSFQQRRPQAPLQSRLRLDPTIPEEQDLGDRYTTLVLELEEVRSRLLAAGAQPAPDIDQGNEPPGYYSHTSLAEVQHPAYTGGEKRNSALYG